MHKLVHKPNTRRDKRHFLLFNTNKEYSNETNKTTPIVAIKEYVFPNNNTTNDKGINGNTKAYISDNPDPNKEALPITKIKVKNTTEIRM